MSSAGDQLRALAKDFERAPAKLARAAANDIAHAGAVLEAGARSAGGEQVGLTQLSAGVQIEATLPPVSTNLPTGAPLAAGTVREVADPLQRAIADAAAGAIGGR